MANCADCAKPGAFWEGEPKGKEVKLSGISAYITQPSSASGTAVVLIPDVWGWDAKNTRLYADKLAAAGFLAVLPDYFQGDNPDLEKMGKGDFSQFMEWKARHEPERVLPETDKVFKALESDYGVKSIGVVGFCWGGRFGCMLGATDKVKAVVMNHGSFIEKENIEAIKQPFLVNASDNDKMISREKLAQFQGVLDCKKDLPSDVKFFEGAEHGWTCRGDDKDPKVGPMVVDAFDRACGWFKKYL